LYGLLYVSEQIGNDCPDVVPAQLKAAWEAVQSVVKQDLVSAGHDISDGGIATTLLEMAFAGGFGSGHEAAYG
jgi:phosphoribosylformylglycinamidine synthase